MLLNPGKDGTNSNLPCRGATASSASVVQAGEENGQRLDPGPDSGAICPPPHRRGLSRRAGRGVWVVEGTEEVKRSDGPRLASRETSQGPLGLTISRPFISWTPTFSSTSCAVVRRLAPSWAATRWQVLSVAFSVIRSFKRRLFGWARSSGGGHSGITLWRLHFDEEEKAEWLVRRPAIRRRTPRPESRRSDPVLASRHGALKGGARLADLGKVGMGFIEMGKKFLVLVGGLVALSRRFIDLAQVKVRQGGEQWGEGNH
jgi:hypothetical protein